LTHSGQNPSDRSATSALLPTGPSGQLTGRTFGRRLASLLACIRRSGDRAEILLGAHTPLSSPSADRKDDKDRIAPQRNRCPIGHRQQRLIDRFHEMGHAGRELEASDPQWPEAMRPKRDENEAGEYD